MDPGSGTGEAVVTFTFVALVFHIAAEVLLALTGASLYFGSCLFVAMLHGYLLHCYVCVMRDAGGDWWRQASMGSGHDIARAVIVACGPWMISFLGSGGVKESGRLW